MALLPNQVMTPAGLDVAFTAASAGGDTLQPGDNTFLHVKTGATGPTTVTIDSVAVCNMGVDHNLVVVVAANDDVQIGPLPAQRFAQPTTGLVNVTYSQVATVTVAAVIGPRT